MFPINLLDLIGIVEKKPEVILDEEVEMDKVYYTLPRNQLQVVEALFSSLENGSALALF